MNILTPDKFKDMSPGVLEDTSSKRHSYLAERIQLNCAAFDLITEFMLSSDVYSFPVPALIDSPKLLHKITVTGETQALCKEIREHYENLFMIKQLKSIKLSTYEQEMIKFFQRSDNHYCTRNDIKLFSKLYMYYKDSEVCDSIQKISTPADERTTVRNKPIRLTLVDTVQYSDNRHKNMLVMYFHDDDKQLYKYCVHHNKLLKHAFECTYKNKPFLYNVSAYTTVNVKLPFTYWECTDLELI